MHKFDGFQENEESKVWLPEAFFSELLPLVDDLAELKVTLFCLWALRQKDGSLRYLRRRDFAENDALMAGLAAVHPDADPDIVLDITLQQTIERGTLLAAEVKLPAGDEVLYFVNTPQGRATIEQIHEGKWQPRDQYNPVELLPARPNIFRLYEENIGPLGSALLMEELKDAVEEYPSTWIEEAIKIAVERNARNWRYIRAILERWKADGKDRGLAEKYGEQDSSKYISGKFAAFITYKPDDE